MKLQRGKYTLTNESVVVISKPGITSSSDGPISKIKLAIKNRIYGEPK